MGWERCEDVRIGELGNWGIGELGNYWGLMIVDGAVLW